MKFDLNLFHSLFLKPEVVKNFPYHLQLEPTNNCNLSCRMCIRDEGNFNLHNLSYDEFVKIYNEISPNKITFAGAGEPTLNKDLLSMISYAHSSKTSTMISSNMTLIDNLAEGLVDSGLNTIKISIDAANSHTYQKIRGKDYFDKIIKGIETLNFYKSEKKRYNPEMRFDFVILKENYKNMADLIILAEKLSIRYIYFRPLQSVGISQERHKDLTEGLNYDDLYRSLELAYRISAAHKIRSNLGELLKNYGNYKNIYLNQDSNFKNEICLLPWFQTFISADGNASVCCALYSNAGMILGNIFKQPFQDIWNGDNYQKVRQYFKAGGKYKVCKDCAPRSFKRLISIASLLPSFVVPGGLEE